MYTVYPQEAPQKSRRSAAEVERQASLMERYNGLDWINVTDCPDEKPAATASVDQSISRALMDCYNC